jgi:hypothetical protein
MRLAHACPGLSSCARRRSSDAIRDVVLSASDQHRVGTLLLVHGRISAPLDAPAAGQQKHGLRHRNPRQWPFRMIAGIDGKERCRVREREAALLSAQLAKRSPAPA